MYVEGVLVVQKNPKLEKHPEIPVPNLHVMMVMKTLKSKDFCEEMFNWQHNYYTLKNEGMEFLRDYLRLPPTVFPATLTKKTPARVQRAGPDAEAGGDSENWRGVCWGLLLFPFINNIYILPFSFIYLILYCYSDAVMLFFSLVAICRAEAEVALWARVA